MEKTKIEIRQLPVSGLRIRSTEDGTESRTIEGVAIVFNRASLPVIDDPELVVREQIAPEAVTQDFLDKQDILATLYHDNDRILARSVNGKGTLSYEVSDDGVHFSFDAPDTEDGRTALELVRRGDVTGCSFAFGIDITDPDAEERTVSRNDKGQKQILYTVKKMAFIRDFTLTPRPAYTDTAVATRMRNAESAAESRGDLEFAMKADLDRLNEIISK